MAWTEPVYDRTQTDIDNQTPKAAYCADDLNRIEQDCNYLAGVFGITIDTRSWARTDFPRPGAFLRILGNIDALRAAYGVYATTPETPVNPVNEYRKANDLEQILHDLYALHEINAAAVMYAGELCAGQTIGVI